MGIFSNVRNRKGGKVLTEQLRDDLGSTVRDGVLNRSFEIDEDLSTLGDTLCKVLGQCPIDRRVGIFTY